MTLDDFLSLLSIAAQLVLSIFVPLGVGALIVSVYEQRKRVKERAVDRFIDLVLAKGLFDLLAIEWDTCNMYEAYDRIKAGRSRFVWVGGSLQSFDSADALEEKLVEMWEKELEAHKRIEESGAFCLMPERVRNQIGDTAEIFQQIRDSMKSQETVSALAERYREQLKRINREIRQIVYQTEL
jgi:hypothetical protein